MSASMLRRKCREMYFSVPISKELDNGKTITYRLKFIDSFRFMSTSLSSLVDNLSEKLHSDKCRDWKFELHYMSFEYNQLIFQCFECKRNYMKDFNKELIKRFANTHIFVMEILINLFCY